MNINPLEISDATTTILPASPGTDQSRKFMSTKSKPLRWGILSTGRIAGVFARGLVATATGEAVAAGSRSMESARAFADRHGIKTAHGCYEDLLADPAVEAVYIATPHPQHAEWVVKAAEAGKHILCEKPLGLNHAEGMVMTQAAKEHGVALMEAFMYRCHPQTARLVELVRDGVIGRVGLIEASFGYRAEFQPDSRVWSNAAAGGGILDVGCYPVSMARLLAGAVDGLPFLDPTTVEGAARLHPETGVDEWAAATLRFPNDVVAQLSTAVAVELQNTVTVYGSAGRIVVPSPWLPNPDGGSSKILLYRRGKDTPEEIIVEAGPLYALEAEAFAAAVRSGQTEAAPMTHADTLGNLTTLDRWRKSAGLVYEAEQPDAAIPTVSRRPLRKRKSAPMTHAEIDGVAIPVSRLIMGCDHQQSLPYGAVMWDDYFERGGNTFDTAHIYNDGLPERLLGHWIKIRGVRDQVVIIGKGAHTPYCNPCDLGRQLEESLERLQTGRVDIYLMHRDNPDVPVGEFVDALNEHARAGRIGVFGGSNWTIQRVEEANRYAKEHDLQGFGALSNNFSLARMVHPVWQGCVSASDADSRRWLREHRFPLLAWSSQARGFFTERAGRDKTNDPELVRCWYSEDNFARRERAATLAAEKGVSPVVIAAAYVLNQPFPTFALFGPRTIAETANSIESLSTPLTEKELAWLNLETENR